VLSRRKATAVEGKDGFHFLANDTNRVLEQITGKVTLTRDRLDAIARSHRERMEVAEAVGAAYRYVIVPNKELVLARFLPDAYMLGARGPTPVQAYLAAGQAERYRSLFFDADYLTKRSREGEVFPRTDNHWSYWGAYHDLLRALDVIGTPEEHAAMKALRGVVRFRTDNVGGLGAKLERPPESMPVVDLHARWIKLLVTNEIHNVSFVRHYHKAKGARAAAHAGAARFDRELAREVHHRHLRRGAVHP
jgi:SGNH hydrolase-like domain, acetyltransferase AlgX